MPPPEASRPGTVLIGRTAAAVEELVAPYVDRRFRAHQVALWVVHRNTASFAEMTNLPRELRHRLAEQFSLVEPAIADLTESQDGSRKYLFRLTDGATVESVAMAGGRRITLCLSSQTGCAVGCTFCVTGALGGGRNLRPEEIAGQYRVMVRDLGAESDRVNIVFMGMGEPLLNTEHLGPALQALAETVSLRRITVSTAGIIPGIRWLAGLPRRPKLAVSLNAPTQALRERIMPITRRYPLADLLAAIRQFPLERGRRITFEYVLIRGFNDHTDQAQALARLIDGVPAKVNLIPLNEDPVYLPDLQPPNEMTIDRFAAALRRSHLTVTVRRSKGADVAAACGQLKGRNLAESEAAR